MGNPNRTALLTKAHKVLKQHYKPVAPPERPVLEHLLFAACLEDAPFEAADKVYSFLTTHFFDLNEVRVSTVTELAEVMRGLPNPQAAASNVKRILQGVFESSYSFELEAIKKQTIGQAIKRLEKLGGATQFSIAYLTQVALGGHSIPLDRGALDVLYVLGIISENEAKSGNVTGLERAIPKNRGIEFGSLLHHAAAEYVANPFSANVRKLLLSINPDAKDRFPKRGVKKEPPPVEVKPAAKPAAPPAATEQPGKKKHEPEKATVHKIEAAKAPPAAAKSDKHPRPPVEPAKPARVEAADKHRPAGHPPHKPAKHDKVEKPKPAAASAKPARSGKVPAVSLKRKSTTKQLAKRKPR